MQFGTSRRTGNPLTCFNTASGTDCMQCGENITLVEIPLVSIPQAVRIACNAMTMINEIEVLKFQYRKRYGLHAITVIPDYSMPQLFVSIPQAVRIACNNEFAGVTFESSCFNTASGTDCMQYCLPKPLETVNPKGGFLILPPCLRFSPNRREFFCRKKRLKRGAKPAIPRKLLSTKKT